MQAQGLLKFVSQVDGEAFRQVCVILASPSLLQASKTLEMPESSLRARVESWKTAAGPFPALAALVLWRRTVKKRVTVRLEEAITSGSATSVDYPGLVADVIEELLKIDDENWAAKVEELTDLLRPYAKS